MRQRLLAAAEDEPGCERIDGFGGELRRSNPARMNDVDAFRGEELLEHVPAVSGHSPETAPLARGYDPLAAETLQLRDERPLGACDDGARAAADEREGQVEHLASAVIVIERGNDLQDRGAGKAPGRAAPASGIDAHARRPAVRSAAPRTGACLG